MSLNIFIFKNRHLVFCYSPPDIALTRAAICWVSEPSFDTAMQLVFEVTVDTVR
jgi:hypothetical protein